MRIQANHFCQVSMRLPALKADELRREVKRKKKVSEEFLIAEIEKVIL